jgi:hypothetical protein
MKHTSEDEEIRKWANELLVRIEIYETKLSKAFNCHIKRY